MTEERKVVLSPTTPAESRRKGIPVNDLLLLILFVAAWFALQRWILPAAGVPT